MASTECLVTLLESLADRIASVEARLRALEGVEESEKLIMIRWARGVLQESEVESRNIRPDNVAKAIDMLGAGSVTWVRKSDVTEVTRALLGVDAGQG